MRPHNPFIIAGYHTPEYFCDRINETKKITDALYNGRNITLIAPRYIGKSTLIKNAFYKLKEQCNDIITIYIDIYSTRSFKDFVQLLSASTISKEVIKGCEEATLKEIFDYLASSDKRCYIAIDEFQQIGEYPQQGVEALLRSYIQFLPNVNFIFSGSKQHVMQEMFLSAKRPFYQSTQTIAIDIIDSNLYYEFANEFFAAQGTALSTECFDYIYQQFSGHTWYVQSILNRLYGYKQSVTSNEVVDRAIQEIVEESTYNYGHLLSAYTDNNVALLKAIAREGVVAEINAGEFISKYNLKASSSVNTSLAKLLDDELIYKTESGYIVYDRFMAIWLRAQLF